MNIVDYTLTIRDKRGQVIAVTHHATPAEGHTTLQWLATQMHTRTEARNTGVLDTGEHGWLWDTDTPEVCIAGTYAIERAA